MALPSTGAKSSVGTSAVQLTPTATALTYGVAVKAAAANTGKVYVGLSSAVTANSSDSTDGYEISAGEEVFVPLAAAKDASNVYVIAGASGQKVYWFAI